MADEFWQADRDDWLLEKAQDEVDRQIDWDHLNGDTRVEDYEAAWRADKRRQAEAADQLLKGDTDEWPRFW